MKNHRDSERFCLQTPKIFLSMCLVICIFTSEHRNSAVIQPTVYLHFLIRSFKFCATKIGLANFAPRTNLL